MRRLPRWQSGPLLLEELDSRILSSSLFLILFPSFAPRLALPLLRNQFPVYRKSKSRAGHSLIFLSFLDQIKPLKKQMDCKEESIDDSPLPFHSG